MLALTGIGPHAADLVTELATSAGEIAIVRINATPTPASSSCDHAQRTIDDVWPVLETARASFAACVRGVHGIVTLQAVIEPSGALTGATVRDSELDGAGQCLVTALGALAFPANDTCPTPITLPIVVR